MTPTLTLLFGFPGVGKLTVARELARLLEAESERVRVVDNHWIANPIFGLVEHDGVTPLPAAVWEHVGAVATAVLETAAELTPPSWHLIFTAVLDGRRDQGFDDRLRDVARRRGSRYRRVRLVCDPAENARRIVSAERRELMKSTDPDEPLRLAATVDVAGHPDVLTIDTTYRSPAESAGEIMAELRAGDSAEGTQPGSSPPATP